MVRTVRPTPWTVQHEVERSGLLVRSVSFDENAVDLAAMMNGVVTVVGA